MGRPMVWPARALAVQARELSVQQSAHPRKDQPAAREQASEPLVARVWGPQQRAHRQMGRQTAWRGPSEQAAARLARALLALRRLGCQQKDPQRVAPEQGGAGQGRASVVLRPAMDARAALRLLGRMDRAKPAAQLALELALVLRRAPAAERGAVAEPRRDRWNRCRTTRPVEVAARGSRRGGLRFRLVSPPRNGRALERLEYCEWLNGPHGGEPRA